MVPRAVPSMLFPVHHQLTMLREVGFSFHFNDVYDKLETLVRAFHLILSADGKARDKANSLVAITAKNGCGVCDVVYVSRVVGRKKDGSVDKRLTFYVSFEEFLQSCQLRTKESMLRDSVAWIRSRNKSEAQKVASNQGCRLSVFAEDPFYDISSGSPFELSHGLIRGI